MAVKVKLVGAPVSNSAPNTKIIKSNSYSSTNTIDLVKGVPSEDLKAYYENPIRMASAMNYKDKPSSLSYNILYQMSVKNSVIAAVINTRVNQVSTFTKPKNDTDDFDTFIRKIVRDSLTYDQACFEVVPDRKGKPAQILAVDASTIRAASEDYQDNTIWSKNPPKKNEKVSWVQVIDGTVVSWFTANEMAFGVRNPRSNINLQPYGFSELEQLIQQITSHLYAEEYNSKFFSQGGTTKGIINIKSDPNGIGNKEQLDSFKRQWRAQVNGMAGAWKTPVLQVPQGIEYINVSQSNRDMEFNQWMNYLINIVCAVYAIDPAEINFANNGGAAGQSSVFESSQEQKLKNSKDKGLKPLLRFVETIINKFVISRFSAEYVFSFTGLDEKSEEEKAELETKQSKVWKTVNEIRKEHGEKPIDDGDVILDASWINYHQQTQMAAQQQEMMAGEGDEGDEYSDEEDTEGYSEPEEDSEEQPSEEGYEEDSEENTEKSMSKLIITIDD